MLEFAVVLMVKRRIFHPEEDTVNIPVFVEGEASLKSTEFVATNIMKNVWKPSNKLPYSFSSTEKIDFVALVTLSMVYFIFNCVYFSYFM